MLDRLSREIIQSLKINVSLKEKRDNRVPQDNIVTVFQENITKNKYPILDEFEKNGHYEKAINWITENWVSLKSWDLLVKFLHFSDLLGEAGHGLTEYTRFVDTIPGTPSDILKSAEMYYVARLRSQMGWIADALNLHQQNFSISGTSDPTYQLKSGFEITQLFFRVEDFSSARTELNRLVNRLEKTSGQDRLWADTLRYLASCEIFHIIHV